MARSRTLAEWLQWQTAVHWAAIDLGLARVRSVAQRLGLLPPVARNLVVAGTNGKGSTVACLAGLLAAQGYRVGAFTSPHLQRYNERIRIDGAEVDDARLLEAFAAIEAARGDTTLTFFEFSTLAALWIFRAQAVDFIVLEVGLGGRLDAVNIVDAEGAIVSSIGMDHVELLGPDLASIAREKAGVFRSGQQVVLADPLMAPEAHARAVEVGAPVQWAGRDYHFATHEGGWSFSGAGLDWPRLALPALPGANQVANAASAIALLAAIGVLRQADAGRAGDTLARLSLPGRFQVVPGPVEWILDVAHNEPAARALAANLDARPCEGRTLAVTGILGDKDAPAIAAVLDARVDEWVLCGIDAPRGLAAAQLAARSPVWSTAHLARDVGQGMALAAGLARPGDRVLVCGSFLAVGPAMQWLGLY